MVLWKTGGHVWCRPGVPMPGSDHIQKEFDVIKLHSFSRHPLW